MTHLLIDHDTKFAAADGVAVKRVAPRAPNLNAFAERWVQSLRRECLDLFVVVGERYFRYMCDQYSLPSEPGAVARASGMSR